jgi:hypothetical protein
MSIKANSTLGAAVAALVMLVPVATLAQSPRYDFPGGRQQGYYYRNDPGLAPRPDFPGAKQPGNVQRKTSRSRHSQKY